MNPQFNSTRLGYFIKRHLYLNVSSLWIAIAAVVGTLLVISALFAYFNPGTLPGLRNLYLVVFFVGGYFFTSKIFDEMHTPQKSYSFLTLPVSATEKLIGGWIITGPVYVLVFALFMVLLLFISSLIADRPEALPFLFDSNFFTSIKVFLVTQTIFFLGACSFRGNNFLKTLLMLFVLVLLIGMYGSGLAFLLFGEGNISVNAYPADLKNTMEFIIKQVIPFIFWYLLGPFLLLVSYFKLKERQV
ncbi:hypothetical protein [Botryobacter ruber]|uniref:hypothetical protein n=1 Tax=Botryobacter ruber TaxID=2171629 RepID=UPI000E0A04A4|nr:hypothetical protein [Botryobacter ruber]